MELILGERGRVGEGLADILLIEVWELLDDLCRRHAVRDEVDYVRHGNPKPTDGRAPGQHVREMGNPIVGSWHDVLESHSSAKARCVLAGSRALRP